MLMDDFVEANKYYKPGQTVFKTKGTLNETKRPPLDVSEAAKRRIIACRQSKKQIERFKKISTDLGVTHSFIIRMLISDFVELNKNVS